MRQTPAGPRVAATDLSNFIQCRHLTLLDLAKASAVPGLPREAPSFARLKALEDRGRQHEKQILDGLIARHPGEVVQIPGRLDATAEERQRLSADALAADAAVIYQGVLIGDGQYGEPDFLIRAQLLDPTDIGGGHVVLDAKLARTAKATAILQTAFYSRLLARQTGIHPRWMYLQLGDGLPPTPFRVADFDAYERATSDRMSEFLDAATPGFPIAAPYPEKVEHCQICSWRIVCRDRRRADDDLSRVAGATTRQRKALKSAGIPTRTALAEAAPDTVVPDLDRSTFERLRLQAEIQVKTKDEDHPEWDWRDSIQSMNSQRDNALLHHEPNAVRKDPLRGLFALPAEDPGDLFFDLEASRFFGGGDEGFGLEYLFGYVKGEDEQYVARWAFDRTQEREVFEWFVQMLFERWQTHPGMHVYHYNHYEPTAMGRLADRHDTMAEMLGALMGRYGTMERETDALLRGKVFVDLYPIFRQAVRAGVESYSLKSTEKVAGYHREQDLAEATEHLIAFERELEEGTAAINDLQAQEKIAAYNEDDCRATLALRLWLEERRVELEAEIGEILRPPLRSMDSDLPRSDLVTALLERKEDGLDGARELLAGLVEYRRREERPARWEYYHLRQLDEDGLLASRSALAGLIYLGAAVDTHEHARVKGRRSVLEFSFPPQEYGVEEEDKLRDPREFRYEPAKAEDGTDYLKPVDGKPWEIVEIDEAAGRLFAARSDPLPAADEMPRTLVTSKESLPPTPTESLEAYGQAVIDSGDVGAWPLGSALLLRTPPRLGGEALPEREPGVSPSDFAQVVALNMERGCLPIQGPPGTGKTYTGAKITLALNEIGDEVRIGVTAYTHKAVSHFMEELQSLDSEGRLKLGQVGDVDQVLHGIKRYPDAAAGLAALQAGEVSVLGGTAWLWSHADARAGGGIVDTLLVDEAGQMPLAYTVAVSGAATQRLILLGDPQQLPQVTQGSHPPGAGASALKHILGDQPVLADGQGIFLGETRRMHGDITSFISRSFYLGELRGAGGLGLDLQAVEGAAPLAGSGVRVDDVAHEGNDSSSIEEAMRVGNLVADLLSRDWTDRHGHRRRLEAADIKVVTPYNAQIRAVLQALAGLEIAGVDVGTVDRFQGSQAAVVVYTMATSTADDASKGMEFLYQLNRLNVAVSRAMALACVVMSPELVRVDCKTPRQMQLASAHCHLREVSTPL